MAVDKEEKGILLVMESLNNQGLKTAEYLHIELAGGSKKLEHHKHVFMWDRSSKGLDGAKGIEVRGNVVKVFIRMNELKEPSLLTTGNLKGDNGLLGGKSKTGAWGYEGDIQRKYLFIEGLDQIDDIGYDDWAKGNGWPNDHAHHVFIHRLATQIWLFLHQQQ